MLDGDTCFRPLSGKGLSNYLQNQTYTMPGNKKFSPPVGERSFKYTFLDYETSTYPRFRPLSGKGLSNDKRTGNP